MIRIETHGTGQRLRMTEQYRFNFCGVVICDIRMQSYICMCVYCMLRTFSRVGNLKEFNNTGECKTFFAHYRHTMYVGI